MRSPADIDESCQRQFGHSADNIGDQGAHSRQAVHVERARNEGQPGEIALLLERVDEGDERDSINCD